MFGDELIDIGIGNYKKGTQRLYKWKPFLGDKLLEISTGNYKKEA